MDTDARLPPLPFRKCLDEMLALCDKYNVMLIGSCLDAGIWGEIQLEEAPAHAPDDLPALRPWNALSWHAGDAAWIVQQIGPTRYSTPQHQEPLC